MTWDEYESVKQGLRLGRPTVVPWWEQQEMLLGPSRPFPSTFTQAVERELGHYSVHAMYRARPIYESFFSKLWSLVPFGFKQSVLACDTALKLVTPLVFQAAHDILDPDSLLRLHAWLFMRLEWDTEDWERAAETMRWWPTFVAGSPPAAEGSASGTPSVYQSLLQEFMRDATVIDRGWPLPAGDYRRFVGVAPESLRARLQEVDNLLERMQRSATSYPSLAGMYYPMATRRVVRLMELFASPEPWLPVLSIAEVIGHYCAQVAYYGFGYLADASPYDTGAEARRLPDTHSPEYWEIFSRWVRVWARAFERRLAVWNAPSAEITDVVGSTNPQAYRDFRRALAQPGQTVLSPQRLREGRGRFVAPDDRWPRTLDQADPSRLYSAVLRRMEKVHPRVAIRWALLAGEMAWEGIFHRVFPGGIQQLAEGEWPGLGPAPGNFFAPSYVRELRTVINATLAYLQGELVLVGRLSSPHEGPTPVTVFQLNEACTRLYQNVESRENGLATMLRGFALLGQAVSREYLQGDGSAPNELAASAVQRFLTALNTARTGAAYGQQHNKEYRDWWEMAVTRFPVHAAGAQVTWKGL